MERNIRSYVARIVSVAVITAVLAPLSLLTSCSSLFNAVDSLNCRTLADTMIEDYFASPKDFNWGKVCEEGYTPDKLDKDQADLLRYVAGKVKYSYVDTVTNDTGLLAKVTYKFSNVPDVRSLDIDEGTVSRFKNEIKSLDTIDLEVTFQCIYQYDEWRFHSLSKFGKYFIHPFCDLKITEGEGTDPTTASTEPSESDSAGHKEIKDKYLASVWYGVETGNPLDDHTVSDAYAVQNVFYFKAPVTGPFEAVMLDDTGKEILRNEIQAIDQVTIVCDFSAGLQGWGTFTPGRYCVELYYDGQKIAVSDYLTVY